MASWLGVLLVAIGLWLFFFGAPVRLFLLVFDPVGMSLWENEGLELEALELHSLPFLLASG